MGNIFFVIAKKQCVKTFGSNNDFICNSIIHCRKRNNIDAYRTEHSSQSLCALTKVRKEDLFRSHGTCILFCSGPSIYEQMKSIKNNAVVLRFHRQLQVTKVMSKVLAWLRESVVGGLNVMNDPKCKKVQSPYTYRWSKKIQFESQNFPQFK